MTIKPLIAGQQTWDGFLRPVLNKEEITFRVGDKVKIKSEIPYYSIKARSISRLKNKKSEAKSGFEMASDVGIIKSINASWGHRSITYSVSLQQFERKILVNCRGEEIEKTN